MSHHQAASSLRPAFPACSLTRLPAETWLSALLRVARVAGKEDEARATYWTMATSDDDREAAMAALIECGLVEVANQLEDLCL